MNTTAPPQKIFAFSLLTLLSGFCGISYEILYGRMLGNLLGDQFLVSSIILLTFMAGIGVGSLYARHLWRFLYAIEGGIGIFGLLFAFSGNYLEQLVYGLPEDLGLNLLTAQLFLSFVILGGPAFLIGCSLPLFSGYLSRLSHKSLFSRTYMLYNFGAALTVLSIEFVLVRRLGLSLSIIVIASINMIVAAILIFFFKHLPDRPEQQTIALATPKRQIIALCLAAVASAVFQLLMVKLASCLYGPFREVFALVVSLILTGIAIGSYLTSRFKLGFMTALLFSLSGLIVLLGGYHVVANLYAINYAAAAVSYTSILLLKWSGLALLMLVPAIGYGSTIPAMLQSSNSLAKDAGRLLFIASMANVAGFLLMAFVLHKYFDYGVLVVLVGALTLAAVVCFDGVVNKRVLIGAALFVVVCISSVRLWQENLLFVGHDKLHSPESFAKARNELGIIEKYKGHQDVFAITYIGGVPYFFINGYISIALDSPLEKIVGAFSSIFSPRTDQALVLGVGSGATASVVANIFERTDAVEINPVILENLDQMRAYNFNIRAIPGINFFVDDAIHYAKITSKKYSFIVNTVTTPLYFGASKLYTRDFLETVSNILTPDGVYVTWVDSRVGGRGMDIMLQTIRQVFPHCWIGGIASRYFLLICSKEELQIQNLQAVTGNKIVNEYFMKEYQLDSRLLPYGILHTNAYDLISDPSVPVNTLNYPSLEFTMARLQRRGFEQFRKRLEMASDPRILSEVSREFLTWNQLEFSLYAELMMKNTVNTAMWLDNMRSTAPDFYQKYMQVKSDYYRSLAATLKTADSYVWYGFALLNQGNWQAAALQFEHALLVDPKTDNANINLGYCYEQLNNPDLALAHYGKEAEIDPDDRIAYLRTADLALKLRLYEKTLKAANSALAIHQDSVAYAFQGLAYEGLMEFGEAEQSFRASLRIDPRNTVSQQGLSRVSGR